MLRSRIFGEEAELISFGPGRYAVLFPGLGYVQNQHGDHYVLDLRRFMDR